MSNLWSTSRKSQGIAKVSRIRPLHTMNIWKEMQESPWGDCWDVSVYTEVVTQMTGIAIPRAMQLAWLEIKLLLLM